MLQMSAELGKISVGDRDSWYSLNTSETSRKRPFNRDLRSFLWIFLRVSSISSTSAGNILDQAKQDAIENLSAGVQR